MINTIELGAGPANEKLAQVDEQGYALKARAECLHYRELIRLAAGVEPVGASIQLLSHCESCLAVRLRLILEYDDDDTTAYDYAKGIEECLPLTWEG